MINLLKKKKNKYIKIYSNKSYKPVDFTKIIGQELDLKSKKNNKGKIFKINNRSQRSLEEIRKAWKIENIINKAKGKIKGSFSQITLSHLSPNRRFVPRGISPIENNIDYSTKKHTQNLMKKYASMLIIPSSNK